MPGSRFSASRICRGFVNILAGKAYLGGCRLNVLARNIYGLALSCYLAPFLRGVVFVGKAALRGGFTTFAPAATAKLN